MDKENKMKLKRADVLKYLTRVSEEVEHPFAKEAAGCSSQCFDDVWHDLGCEETGYLSWH